MGRADEYQFDYLDDNVRFADQVNGGTEHPWDGAKCLYDLLQIDERLKPYVSNYRLNL